MRGAVRIERLGKLRAVGAKPLAQQLLQFSVEALDPVADFLPIGGAIGRGIDRQATPASLDARAERNKPRQPALDRVTRPRAFLEAALGVRGTALAIAVQKLQEH